MGVIDPKLMQRYLDEIAKSGVTICKAANIAAFTAAPGAAPITSNFVLSFAGTRNGAELVEGTHIQVDFEMAAEVYHQLGQALLAVVQAEQQYGISQS